MGALQDQLQKVQGEIAEVSALQAQAASATALASGGSPSASSAAAADVRMGDSSGQPAPPSRPNLPWASFAMDRYDASAMELLGACGAAGMGEEGINQIRRALFLAQQQARQAVQEHDILGDKRVQHINLSQGEVHQGDVNWAVGKTHSPMSPMQEGAKAQEQGPASLGSKGDEWDQWGHYSKCCWG